MGVPRYTPERTKSLKKEKKRKKIPTDITTLLTDFPRPLNHQLSGIAWGQRKTIMQSGNTIGVMECGMSRAKIPKMATNPNFLAGWCHMTCKGSKYPCLRTMDCKQSLLHLRRKVNLPVIPAVSPFPVSSFLLLRGQIDGTTSRWCFPFCYHGFGIYCTVDDDTGQELVHSITPLRGSVCTIPPQPLNALQKDIRRVITGMGKNVGELVKLRTFLPPHVVFNPQQQLVYVNPKTNPQGLISAGKDPYEINYGNLTLYCIYDNTLPNKTRWFVYFKMSQHPEIYTSLYFVNGWRLCFPYEVKTHLFLDN
jgi:hypothetical protein